MFRGPSALGVSEAEGLPARWGEGGGDRVETGGDGRIAWSLALTPWGNSSPAVAGGRLFLTSQRDDQVLLVIAVDAASGRLLWEREVGKGTREHHRLHNMATPTPATDGQRVWALFGTGDFVSLEADGTIRWHRNLEEEYGRYRIKWGMGTSPILHGDRLYVACMHGGPSYVLAVDKGSGKTVWKTPRDLPCRGEASDAYSSPILAGGDDDPRLVVAGADHVTAYDLSDGRELWRLRTLAIDTPYGRSIASPTAGGGRLFVPTSNFGNLGRLVALSDAGAGAGTPPQVLWTYEKFSPDCPSPVCYRGRVYTIRDDGVGSCLDARSGELVWRRRIFRGDVKASPVAADGKIYFLSVGGECAVIEARGEGRELARNKLAGRFLATPAIAGGRIYFRAQDRLYAVEASPKTP